MQDAEESMRRDLKEEVGCWANKEEDRESVEEEGEAGGGKVVDDGGDENSHKPSHGDLNQMQSENENWEGAGASHENGILDDWTSKDLERQEDKSPMLEDEEETVERSCSKQDYQADLDENEADRLQGHGENEVAQENQDFHERDYGNGCTSEELEEEETEEEGNSQKPEGEEKTETESCSLQDFQKYLDEDEFSTDDEEEETEVVECDDEDPVKMYSKDVHPTEVFRTLTEFRDSSLLTDLVLKTHDGKTFLVHSIVLAAISSYILKRLRQRKTGNHGRKANATSVGTNRWSLHLGREVVNIGLEAVVEFAYSGVVSDLNKATIEPVKAAARYLGAPRVVDLCTKEEQKKDDKFPAVQMVVSLQSIRQLRKDGIGCDVVLESMGKSFNVHRVILAACSDYFRGMFTLGMRESTQPSVNLPFLLSSELGALINCSYSGALALSWRYIFELTSTALQLQFQPGLSLCLRFLQEDINPNTCLDVASFAKAYGMVPLLESAEDFILQQFQNVACTLKFKDLPVRQLYKYLNSHSLCVTSELVVFKAVVEWIQARPKIRIKLAKELMKTIHFCLMSFKEFKEVQSLNLWSDHGLEELYQEILEAFYSNEIVPQSQYRIYLPKETLVLIGGDQISEDLRIREISRELWFGNALRNHMETKMDVEWRKLAELPELPRFSHEVAVLHGQLYVFGGKMYYGLGDTLGTVLRYDPNDNRWESLAEMRQRRCYFSVVVLEEQIYAIGGHCDSVYIDSVERYCPTTNSWSFMRPLDLPLCGHMARVSQGQIFISGGMDSDYSCLSSMIRYHPETGSTYLANMAEPRAHHCMEMLGDRFYVAGGITVDQSLTGKRDLLTCEVYNPARDAWFEVASLSVAHVGAGSAVWEGKFYVLGGYSQEDYSDTKMVHRYNPVSHRWENMGKMPGPNNDIRASVLCLPRHLRT